MPVSAIFNTISDLDDTPLPGVNVIARLKPDVPHYRIDDNSALSQSERSVSDVNGYWSLALERNSNIRPGGSWYEITEEVPVRAGGNRTTPVLVGNANSSLQGARISETPDSPPIGTALTQAQADGRYVKGIISLSSQPSAPLAAVTEDLWVDTDATGAAGSFVPTTHLTDPVAHTTYLLRGVSQSSQPSAPLANDLWLDTGATPTTVTHFTDANAHTGTFVRVNEGPLSLMDSRVNAALDGTDETAEVNTAIGLLPADGGVIEVPLTAGGLGLGSQVSVNKYGVVLRGLGSGGPFTGPVIKYVGAQDNTKSMFDVANTIHGFTLENFILDGNLLAGKCVHVHADTGTSTHRPAFKRIHFKGYRTRGLVLGLDDTSTYNNGTMQSVKAENLSFGGGVAGAIGVLLNAANCEWLDIDMGYFDPDVGKEHAYHVYSRAGGLRLSSIVTTRSTTYAIFAAEQFDISGWRGEEEFLLDTHESDVRAGSTLAGLLQRANLVISPTAQSVRILGTRTLDLRALHMMGSIAFGSTSAKYVSSEGVRFYQAGGGYIYTGTQNVQGCLTDATTGTTELRGSAAKLIGKTAAGVERWNMKNTGPEWGRTAPEMRAVAVETQHAYAYGSDPGDMVLRVDDATKKVRIVAGGGGAPLVVGDTKLGFFEATPVVKPTGVAVTAAAIHAALVSLGLIGA